MASTPYRLSLWGVACGLASMLVAFWLTLSPHEEARASSPVIFTQTPITLTLWTFDLASREPEFDLTGNAAASAGSGLGSESFVLGFDDRGLAWSFNSWSLGSLDPNDYFEFALSLQQYALVELSFDERRSATGPRTFEIYYSTDGSSFTPLTTTTTVPDDTTWRSHLFDLSALNASLRGQPWVIFRLYGFAAEGNSGTWRIDNVRFRGVRLPHLELSKTAPHWASPGEVLTYTLVVTNATGNTLHELTLLDPLPPNTAFQAASDEGMLIGDVVSWTMTADFPDGASLTRTLAVIVGATDEITNAAYRVSAADWLTPTFGAPVTTTVTPLELSVGLDAPIFGVSGETLVYTLSLQSRGTATATQVVLTDTLPMSCTYLADSSGLTPAIPAPGVYRWDFGDLPPNTTRTFRLTTTVEAATPGGTMLVNGLVASTTASSDRPENNVITASTQVFPFVSIHDIQYVPDPLSADASPFAGQYVWTEGIVTARPGELDTPWHSLVIQMETGGPWSGLLVYSLYGFEGLDAPEGTRLRVLGLVQEYYGQTEIALLDATAAIVLLGAADPLTPTDLTTGLFPDAAPALSEPWEGVLLQFTEAVVTQSGLGYGEWLFDDGSGPARADDLGSYDGNLSYVPTVGDRYTALRGIGWYSFGRYKLQPRSDADVGLLLSSPSIEKSAASNVAAGGLLTYTLTLANRLGYPLTGLIVTDTVPLHTQFAAASDGGVYEDGIVTWSIPSLPYLASQSFQLVVTATGEAGTVIVNQEYTFTAQEWPTPTFGAPVLTVIGDHIPIFILQGTQPASPWRERWVHTRGVVTGRFQGNRAEGGIFNGFFIQGEADGNPATSDGIFVNLGSATPSVSLGDLVEVSGTVQEFDEYDGAACRGDCLTQIAAAASGVGVIAQGGAVSPTVLQPPGEPLTAAAYFESLEGMLVHLPMTATVVGPTEYGTVFVIPGDEPITRLMRTSPQAGMAFGVRSWERYGGDAPNLAVGSVITGVAGPLTFSFGAFLAVTQPQAPWSVVFSQPLPAEVPFAPAAETFSLATFNTLNFGTTGTKVEKVALTIQQLNAPAIVALQEVSPTAVLVDLVSKLDDLGYPYDYAYSHPDGRGYGVVVLWRNDQVSDVYWSTDQACSAYGDTQASYDPMWEHCRSLGLYPLFSRRPVVLTATLGSETYVVIANHFKSKDGTAQAEMRRLEQAQFVAALADALVAAASPHVVVLGDLNDFENAAPLQALLESGTLTNTWFTLPPQARYSYNFHGLSQALDHILISTSLMDQFDQLCPLHLNADYPMKPYATDREVAWRTSDHDPLVVSFRLRRVYLPIIVR